MQKITPHLWFDKEAKEAAEFYVATFDGDSKVKHVSQLHDTPSGTVEIVTFDVLGYNLMAMSAGPLFKFNPSVSFFLIFDNEAEIEGTWNKLKRGGKVLMEYQTYPWAQKYGWLQDKYGLSWQLSWSEHHRLGQKITPLLMFTKTMSGKTKEAIAFYTSIFPDSKTERLAEYQKGEGDTAGFIKHARFTLSGQLFMAMDSSGPHNFAFNEAISLMVYCADQQEIDYYWSKLSAVPEAEQCGWLKDKYGVSWQIVPTAMDEMMGKGSKEQIARVTQALLKMKKLNLAELDRAFFNQH